MRKAGLIINFYKSYAFSAFAISVACMYFPFVYGLSTFSALFWFKIVTLIMIYYLNNTYKHHEFYYYKNLGVSKKTLWISTLSFDFILFISMFFITLKLR